jgi:hypothetical protein
MWFHIASNFLKEKEKMKLTVHNTCYYSVNEKTKITNSNLSHKPIGNTDQKMGVYRLLNLSEVGSGPMEKYASPVDRSHPPRALFPD